MGKGFSRRTYRKSELNAYEMLAAHTFGVGANMAFRRRVFSEIGSFDVALDVGTPTGGGRLGYVPSADCQGAHVSL